MKIVVQKFGGTSVGDPERIRRVAGRVVETHRRGFRVVAVVSAMGHATDELLELVRQVAPDPPRRELDVLLATGEHVSMALLAMAITGLGEEAVSLSGAQCGILTNDVHSNARILEIRPGRVRRELSQGRIVVAAGYQGVTREHQVTTLGRGGSDTTAVALAAALGAERCEIYTDVEGVYTADPRVVERAELIRRIRGPEMEELAWHGAQVVKAEAVELANSNAVPVRVLSSFGGAGGTCIDPVDLDPVEVGGPDDPAAAQVEVYLPHRPPVSGVSGRQDLVRLGLDGSAFGSSVREEVFAEVAKYDLIFGGLNGAGSVDLLLSDKEIPDVGTFHRSLEEHFGSAVEVEETLGAVTLVGFGLGSRPASMLAALQVLQRRGVEVRKIFTGRESLSFVVPRGAVEEGVRALHQAFIEEGPEDRTRRAAAVAGREVL